MDTPNPRDDRPLEKWQQDLLDRLREHYAKSVTSHTCDQDCGCEQLLTPFPN